MLSAVIWNVDPAAISIGAFSIRWYGLLFAVGFLIGYYIEAKIFKNDKAPEDWCDKLFIYTLVSTVIGARLGHCLFYAWDYYSVNPLEILKIWEGGLASHGGALGILVAIWIYSKKVTKKSPLWTLDRLVIPTALVAAMIRLGNLMNHEIFGDQTTMPWGFQFIDNLSAWQQGATATYTVTSHPTQIYEAFAYFVLFVVLMFLYWNRKAGDKRGYLFGIFLMWVFVARFLIEYIKLPQEAFEEDLRAQITLNMGQLLSIPFVILGAYFYLNGMNNDKSGKIRNKKKHIKKHYKFE